MESRLFDFSRSHVFRFIKQKRKKVLACTFVCFFSSFVCLCFFFYKYMNICVYTHTSLPHFPYVFLIYTTLFFFFLLFVFYYLRPKTLATPAGRRRRWSRHFSETPRAIHLLLSTIHSNTPIAKINVELLLKQTSYS